MFVAYTPIHSTVCLKTGPQPLPKPVLTQCDLMLRLSIYSVFLFTQRHPVAAYIFFLVFASLLNNFSVSLYVQKFKFKN